MSVSDTARGQVYPLAFPLATALVFADGRLTWLRRHWREGDCVPLISSVTVTELTRVLGYPKFSLSAGDRRELLSDYLPFTRSCTAVETSPYYGAWGVVGPVAITEASLRQHRLP